MPIVPIPKKQLLQHLGQNAPQTDDAFQDLCFEIGIELDDVETAPTPKAPNTAPEPEAPEETIYKIEVPANRYDLLCLEGMRRALAVFCGVSTSPTYSLSGPASIDVTVRASTAAVRPFIVCAVLRDCNFGARAYHSFLDLQERLHHNIARRRTLVAIGTHDLDTLTPPFVYTAESPRDISFVPLAQTREFNAEELFEYYNDPKINSPLRKFLPILEGQPAYPVVYDANGTVCSLPPIINGEHSRISPETRNVFVECTCTDLTKGHMVLNTIVAMFSEYSSTPFSVEPVRVTYDEGGERLSGTTVTTPDLTQRVVTAGVGYIQRSVGLSDAELPAADIPPLLRRMMLDASLEEGDSVVRVRAPITRPDVMHACDVMEDVAVAYSFNRLPRPLPPVQSTGSQQPIMKLTELVRLEMAQMGFTEALTFALCSRAENFEKMRRADDGAVVLSNPKTEEFQVCRTSLLPGLLKTLERNRGNPLPWKLFEASDVVLLDSSADVGATNLRRLAVVFADVATSGFEVVHGAVERALLMLGPRAAGYTISAGSNPSFLEGRCAEVKLADGTQIGHFGTFHPEVLVNFDLDYPASGAELDLSVFERAN